MINVQIPNKTSSTAVFPSRARIEMTQMRTRRETPDMMSSQGLKSSGVGLQEELEQWSL